MDIEYIYVDIMTEEKLSSIWVTNMDITYWSVRSSSKKGGDGIERCSVILAN